MIEENNMRKRNRKNSLTHSMANCKNAQQWTGKFSTICYLESFTESVTTWCILLASGNLRWCVSIDHDLTAEIEDVIHQEGMPFVLVPTWTIVEQWVCRHRAPSTWISRRSSSTTRPPSGITREPRRPRAPWATGRKRCLNNAQPCDRWWFNSHTNSLL